MLAFDTPVAQYLGAIDRRRPTSIFHPKTTSRSTAGPRNNPLHPNTRRASKQQCPATAQVG